MNEDGPRASAPALSVFAAGNQTTSVIDILDAAWFRGDLAPHWQIVLAGVAREQQAEAAAPDEEQLQSFSEEIRYRHELITSEETETWLTAHELSLDDFTDHCHRRHWMECETNEVPVEQVRYFAAPVELRELLLKHLWFEGTVDELACALAWRIAAAVDDAPSPSENERETQRREFLLRTALNAETLPDALQQLGRDVPWLESLLDLEAIYTRQCDRVRTNENRIRTLAALRLPLTRFEVEIMDVESEDAAREARLCIETDGLSMTELAEQEHYRIERRSCLLEEFPEEVQLRFLGAEKGQVRQIDTAGERFQICRILDKCEPTLADENVVRRIDEELIAAHFQNLVAKRIVWLIPRSPSS